VKARFFWAVALLAPLAARADLEPGRWEITATTQMEGMPQPIGPITRMECLDSRAASDPGSVLGTGAGTCEFSNRREDGGTYTFDVVCTGAFPMRGTGSVRYDPRALQGSLSLGADVSGKRISMNSTVIGRRIGDCSP